MYILVFDTDGTKCAVITAKWDGKQKSSLGWCKSSNPKIEEYFLIYKCCPLLISLMSDSPILQNGKIVGAVTHVFVNDPTRGYGIFIENMLAETEKIK